MQQCSKGVDRNHQPTSFEEGCYNPIYIGPYSQTCVHLGTYLVECMAKVLQSSLESWIEKDAGLELFLSVGFSSKGVTQADTLP